MQSESWWARVKFLVNVYKELKKAARPRTIIGYRIIVASLVSLPFVSWGIIFGFDSIPFLSEINIAQNQVSVWSSVLNTAAFVFGIMLVLYDIHLEKNQSRKVARLFICGLPNMEETFSDKILSTAEKAVAREPVQLSLKNINVSTQVEMFNAESKVNLISRFVTHADCQKLYIGGLARIPLLIAYGAMLRNTSGITYFDKLHANGKWTLLDDVDNEIDLIFNNEEITANDDGAIGLALGMSTHILVEQLPNELQKHTIFIEHTGDKERNKVKNQDNLHRVSEKLAGFIDLLSAQKEVKVIHFFLSIQSTLALEIGRRYQEGIHKDWIIHNYDAPTHCYPWSLRLSGQSLEVVQ